MLVDFEFHQHEIKIVIVINFALKANGQGTVSNVVVSSTSV